MTITPALIVLNPRTIPPALNAIRALRPPAGTAWLTGYTETELQDGAFHDAITQLPDATHIITISDDCQPTQAAYDAIVAQLHAQPDHPATGWCVVDTQPGQQQTSITEPLRGTKPEPDAYTFLTRPQVLAHAPLIQTGLASFALTAIPRTIWQDHPFGCYQPPYPRTEGQPYGWASDFHLSIRLRDHAIPIHAPTAAECTHHRAHWQQPDPARPLDRLGQRTTTIT